LRFAQEEYAGQIFASAADEPAFGPENL